MLAFLAMGLPSTSGVWWHGVGGFRASWRANFSGAKTCGGGAMRRSAEKGGSTLKALIWTAILVGIIYAAFVALPVFISEYEFQDSLQDIARFGTVNRRNNDQIRKAVLDEAQKEDLPVQDENIKVDGSAGNVHIKVDYSVVVDFKVYKWTVDFHPAANNAAL
jgi:hypothetical protein